LKPASNLSIPIQSHRSALARSDTLTVCRNVLLIYLVILNPIVAT